MCAHVAWRCHSCKAVGIQLAQQSVLSYCEYASNQKTLCFSVDMVLQIYLYTCPKIHWHTWDFYIKGPELSFPSDSRVLHDGITSAVNLLGLFLSLLLFVALSVAICCSACSFTCFQNRGLMRFFIGGQTLNPQSSTPNFAKSFIRSQP